MGCKSQSGRRRSNGTASYRCGAANSQAKGSRLDSVSGKLPSDTEGVKLSGSPDREACGGCVSPFRFLCLFVSPGPMSPPRVFIAAGFKLRAIISRMVGGRCRCCCIATPSLPIIPKWRPAGPKPRSSSTSGLVACSCTCAGLSILATVCSLILWQGA